MQSKESDVSVLPKVYVVRPNELRELAMRWLVKVDDHLTSEEPDNAPGSKVS